MVVPPPRNILRASSPTSHGEREFFTCRGKRRLHTEPAVPLDPLDYAKGVPAYTPIKAATRDYGEHNYMLEAAAALGHWDVVVTLLSKRDGGTEGRDALQDALVAACRHGRFRVVEGIMSEGYWFKSDLHEPLRMAALHGHDDISCVLLRRLPEQETSTTFWKGILLALVPGNPSMFSKTIQKVKQALSRSDFQRILAVCLPQVAAAGSVDTVKAIMEETSTITPRDLCYAFDQACGAGKADVACFIYSSTDPSPIDTPQLASRIRDAAEDGHNHLLQSFLGKFIDADFEHQLDDIICLAAGAGSLETMMTLLLWPPPRRFDNHRALDKALVSGALDGQQSICAYLVSQGANPLQIVSVAPQSNSFGRFCLSRSVTYNTVVAQDAIQSCLAGFERFAIEEDNREGGYAHNPESPRNAEEEESQIRTLLLLLESVDCFDEESWSHKIGTAVSFCPPEVLEILLDKGRRAGCTKVNKSHLKRAVVRGRWNYPTLKLLLRAGADQDLDDDDLRQLLASTLSQFDGHSRHDRMSRMRSLADGGLFPAIQSLEELFVSGCGAVVRYFLNRAPHEDASGHGYAVLLQIAAAANQLDLVNLLITREVDVNATGSHYGTALQAACRFAHTDVAEALLNAGADPNLIEGEYCTALRAAVVSGSLPTVLLLLQSHAATELTGSRHWDTKNMQPTALHLAVQKKHAAIACALVNAGATVVNAQGDGKWPTLLVTACEWGECSVVGALIAAGANIHETCPLEDSHFHGFASAMHAAISGVHHDVVKILVSHGFDLTASFPRGVDVLTCAVHREDLVMVATLLELLPRGCDSILLRASGAAVAHDCLTILGMLFDAAWDANSLPVLLELCGTACRTSNELTVEFLFDRLFALDSESIVSSTPDEIDIRTVRSELFDVWLSYLPFTIELFVEACVRGDGDVVERGIYLGHRPDDEDKWARHPLHLAAARGKVSVVQCLLEARPDINRTNARYGAVTLSTLEGYLAEKLACRSTNEYDQSHLAELAGLDLDYWRSPNYYLDQHLSRKGLQVSHNSREACQKILELLLSYGARADSPPGRFGTALTLAAFAGLEATFDLLVLHGAQVSEAGGALGSPLSAAIGQGHLKLVDKMLSMASRSEHPPSTENDYLHRACKIGSLSMVIKLLELGHKPNTEDRKGRTALAIALGEYSVDWEAQPNKERIIHVLMDADTRPILSSNDLEAAASISDFHARDKILDRVVASMGQHKIPEESFLGLLKRHSGEDLLRRILDKRAVTSVTTSMLGSACDARTMELLLDHDPSYVVTSATVDAVQNGSTDDKRRVVKTLLLRNTSLSPTESQVLKVLTSGRDYDDWSTRDGELSLLDLMFSRNPGLSVTQEMIETVRLPGDLKALLARLEHGKHVVSDRVLEALIPLRRSSESIASSESPRGFDEDTTFFSSLESGQKRRRHWKELLEIFLKFEPSVKIPPEVAQQLLKDGDLDTVELLLNHDDSIMLSSEKVASMIYGYTDQREFTKTLENHPRQYAMTQEVKAAVDARFRLHSEKPLKEMYYRLAGWTDDKAQSLQETEVT